MSEKKQKSPLFDGFGKKLEVVYVWQLRYYLAGLFNYITGR